MFTIYVSLLKCNECIHLIEKQNEEAGKMPEQHTKGYEHNCARKRKGAFNASRM